MTTAGIKGIKNVAPPNVFLGIGPSLRSHEIAADKLYRVLTESVGLHATGSVDRVAEQTVARHLVTDNSRHHRS